MAFIGRQIIRTSAALRMPGIQSTRTLSLSRLYLAESQPQPSVDSITLSDACVKRLNAISKDGSFLRVVVEGGGCSGFQYKFDLDNEMTDEDLVFEKDGAKVVVDKESHEFVKGSMIDYYEELIRSAFRIIDNPNAEQGCSCGVSFSIK